MQKYFFQDYFTDILLQKPVNEILVNIIAKVSSACCDRTYERIANIMHSLINQDKEKIKAECYSGLPDDLPGLRSLIWSINLHYIPYDSTKWKSVLDLKRNEYNSLKEALSLRLKAEFQIVSDYKKKMSDELSSEKEKEDISKLLKLTDKDLLESIDKDINRTHINFNFFSKPVHEDAMLSEEQIENIMERKRNCVYSDPEQVYNKETHNISEPNNKETHSDILGRILYIYSKINKDVNYVQGMNEILAPIYYCLASDLSFSENMRNVEADAYWCFTNLMGYIKGTFMQKKDNDKTGVFYKGKRMEMIIEKYNKKVYHHFQKLNFESIQFGFKWFNLLFAQDFIMPDILRLWDVLFCEEDKFYFIYFFGLALIKKNEKYILESDFYNIMTLFQEINNQDIEELIEEALKIKRAHEKKIKEIIYEGKPVPELENLKNEILIISYKKNNQGIQNENNNQKILNNNNQSTKNKVNGFEKQVSPP